jgi:hypothetical protein
VPEGFNPIDGNNWNIKLVKSQQVAITFNVDLLKGIFSIAIRRSHRLLSVIAEMTAWARVQDHLMFLGAGLHITHQCEHFTAF